MSDSYPERAHMKERTILPGRLQILAMTAPRRCERHEDVLVRVLQTRLSTCVKRQGTVTHNNGIIECGDVKDLVGGWCGRLNAGFHARLCRDANSSTVSASSWNKDEKTVYQKSNMQPT